MKAEDTVMTEQHLEKLLGEDFSTAYSGHVAECKLIANTQATITYKTAIKEVVEWLQARREGGYNFCVKAPLSEWKAKLKEWGIE